MAQGNSSKFLLSLWIIPIGKNSVCGMDLEMNHGGGAVSDFNCLSMLMFMVSILASICKGYINTTLMVRKLYILLFFFFFLT